jgi:hypothetical protein
MNGSHCTFYNAMYYKTGYFHFQTLLLTLLKIDFVRTHKMQTTWLLIWFIKIGILTEINFLYSHSHGPNIYTGTKP